MNMLEKIQLLMEERELSRADVSRGADIPYTTIDGLFKKGVENARFPTLKKLASFFNVSMEYLINDEVEDRHKDKLDDFSPEEMKLISMWRQLSRDEQMRILGRIEVILERE